VEKLLWENAAIQTLFRRHVRERPELTEIEALVGIALPDDHLRIQNSLEVIG
jgi:hypothetical protein